MSEQEWRRRLRHHLRGYGCTERLARECAKEADFDKAITPQFAASIIMEGVIDDAMQERRRSK